MMEENGPAMMALFDQRHWPPNLPLFRRQGPLIDVEVFYEPEPPAYRIEAEHRRGIKGTVWVRADHAPIWGVDASDRALIEQEVDFMCRDLQAWCDESGVRDHGE